MNKYQQRKEQARREAQALQVYQGAMSWGEVAQQCERLEKLARKYGLIKEFRNEGIL